MQQVKTRIQVSLHPDLVAAAERLMASRQYTSFSGYLETLIREERDRRQPTAPAPLHDQPVNSPIPAANADAETILAALSAVVDGPLSKPKPHSPKPATSAATPAVSYSKAHRRTAPKRKAAAKDSKP